MDQETQRPLEQQEITTYWDYFTNLKKFETHLLDPVQSRLRRIILLNDNQIHNK